MASQYDEMRDQASEIRKTIESSQQLASAMKQKSDGLFAATAIVKTSLEQTYRSTRKVLNETDSMKKTPEKMERPDLLQNTNKGKRKIRI